MRPKHRRARMSADLVIAIGLVWGHLSARQFEEAFLLAQGCLRVWPDERNLLLMHAYAAAEVLKPIHVDKLLAIKDPECQEWIRLVLRRAGLDFLKQSGEHENMQVSGTMLPAAPAERGATNQENTP